MSHLSGLAPFIDQHAVTKNRLAQKQLLVKRINDVLKPALTAIVEHTTKNRWDAKRWYLATPYSNYPEGHNAAWKDAVTVSALLTTKGIHNYSPIVAFHPVKAHAQLPGDADFWAVRNNIDLRECCGVIVAELPGWDASAGVKAEINFAREARKPVVYLPVPVELLGR